MTAIELSGREHLIVQLLARFKQASSPQIHELIFPDVTHTPVYRALNRLTAAGYVHTIERRIVGGSKGGSGVRVYTLGRRGFFMFYDGRYSPLRSVNYHALAILDSYIALRRLESAGRFAILGYSTEPDCWVKIGGNQLMPDMYAEVDRGPAGRLKVWLEIDMATEGQRQLREKLERYWRAFNEADATDWPTFPSVLWVAIDDERAKELRWIIGQLPAEAQSLFRVRTLQTLPTVFGG